MRGDVKIFFDGGYRSSPPEMETAVVVRGQAYIRHGLGPGSSMEAEWLALIQAAEIARQLGLTGAILLGDALAVIGQATGKVKCPAAYAAHFMKWQEISGTHRVRYIKRSQNLAGIELARIDQR